MLQTYQGCFQNGRFISSELAEIPDNVEVYVMVTGREFSLSKTKAQRQGTAIKRFMAAIDKNDEMFTDEDFAQLENNRANFNREVEL